MGISGYLIFQNQQHTVGHKWFLECPCRKLNFLVTFQWFFFPTLVRTQKSDTNEALSFVCT